MIRVYRCAAPADLTSEKQRELVAKFKESNAKVWNRKFIRSTLLAMSHSKCCYCETDISVESKYMEVEHFRFKEDFPDDVVTWSNLLPSCKRCNVNKGTHNVDTQGMIIDPTLISPKDHLTMRNYRLRGLTSLGQKTIEVVYLNQSDRLVKARFNVGERTLKALEKIRELYTDYEQSSDINLQRRILRGIEELLSEAGPTKEYSATTATVLAESLDFKYLKERLTARNLWTSSLEELHKIALQAALGEIAA